MNQFLSTTLIAFILTSSLYSADRITGTEGVINEFAKTEEYTKNRKISKEYRKKTLESNLANAIRYTMHKKFPDYQSRIKDLKPDAIKFEQEKGTFNYFLNYKEYYIFYNFAVDPEVYLQLPVDEKMYIKLADQDKETANSAAPPAKAAAPTTDSSKGPNKPIGTNP
ncbi:MAG: hypothetical protein IPL26_19270 [Leptospiraceae bacterium]|nr:hypothetical protein [Leptospiraceae bacterium]